MGERVAERETDSNSSMGTQAILHNKEILLPIMGKHRKSRKEGKIVNHVLRSLVVGLLIFILLGSLDDTGIVEETVENIFDDILQDLKAYPKAEEFLTKQGYVNSYVIFDTVSVINMIITYGLIINSIFMACDISLIGGLGINHSYAKWLLIPWMIKYSIILIVSGIVPFIFTLFALNLGLLRSWRMCVAVAIVDCSFLQLLSIVYIPFYRVVKQFAKMRSGLGIWRNISPDLESDTVYLISNSNK